MPTCFINFYISFLILHLNVIRFSVFSGYTAPRIDYYLFIDGLGSFSIYQESPKCKATDFSMRCRYLDDCFLPGSALSSLSHVRRFECKYSDKQDKKQFHSFMNLELLIRVPCRSYFIILEWCKQHLFENLTVSINELNCQVLKIMPAHIYQRFLRRFVLLLILPDKKKQCSEI